jgi:hypothetical protein
MLQASVQAGAEVTNTPARKRQYDHAKLSSSICQLVSRSGWMVGIELSMYQAVGLESFEATRQHIGSDPGQTLLKILESHGAGKQVSDDEQCPSRTNNLKRSGDGARLTEVCFYHSRASSFGGASYLQANSFYIGQYCLAKKGHSGPGLRLSGKAAAVRTVRSPRQQDTGRSWLDARRARPIDDTHHIEKSKAEPYMAFGASSVSSKAEHE